MHPEKPLRAYHRPCQIVYRQRGGVGDDDGIRRRGFRAGSEDLVFEVEVFEDRLEYEPGVARGFRRAICRLDGLGPPGRLRREQPRLRVPPGALDQPLLRLPGHLRRRVREPHLDARGGEAL